MFQRSPALVLVYRRRKANDSPAYRITQAWYRDTSTRRHRGNSENRIKAGHRGAGTRSALLRRCPGLQGRLGRASITVVSPIGWFPGRVAEWRTRWLQGPVAFGTWGFKSP